MFLSTLHKKYYSELEMRFPIRYTEEKAVHLLLSIPAIYESFEQTFATLRYKPIDIALLYLNEMASPVSNRALSREEVYLLQFAVEIWNGQSHLKRGVFRLNKALGVWNEDYINLFYDVLQLVRPRPQMIAL